MHRPLLRYDIPHSVMNLSISILAPFFFQSHLTFLVCSFCVLLCNMRDKEKSGASHFVKAQENLSSKRF